MIQFTTKYWKAARVAASTEEAVTMLRTSSYDELETNEQYMRAVARRIRIKYRALISTTSVGEFFRDLERLGEIDVQWTFVAHQGPTNESE